MSIRSPKRDLRSIDEVKTALGRTARELLRELDCSRYERNATEAAALRLQRFAQNPRLCWACGDSKETNSAIAEVQAAHVFPIEEGGVTYPENLIPLCARRREQFRENMSDAVLVEALGCHTLADLGMISRVELVALQARLSPDARIRPKLQETARKAPREIKARHVRKDKAKAREEFEADLKKVSKKVSDI